MTAELEAKLYAAVLYAITERVRSAQRVIPLDVYDRTDLAERIVAEILERKILG